MWYKLLTRAFMEFCIIALQCWKKKIHPVFSSFPDACFRNYSQEYLSRLCLFSFFFGGELWQDLTVCLKLALKLPQSSSRQFLYFRLLSARVTAPQLSVPVKTVPVILIVSYHSARCHLIIDIANQSIISLLWNSVTFWEYNIYVFFLISPCMLWKNLMQIISN